MHALFALLNPASRTSTSYPNPRPQTQTLLTASICQRRLTGTSISEHLEFSSFGFRLWSIGRSEFLLLCFCFSTPRAFGFLTSLAGGSGFWAVRCFPRFSYLAMLLVMLYETGMLGRIYAECEGFSADESGRKTPGFRPSRGRDACLPHGTHGTHGKLHKDDPTC